MGRQTGLLEESFSDALSKVPDGTGITQFLKYCAKGPMPAQVPKTSEGVLERCREVYREYQPLLDAAIIGAAEFLSTAEGAIHVKALQASLADRQESAIGREIAKRMYDAPEFRAMREQQASSDLEAVGVGASGGLFALIGIYGGIEYLFNDPNASSRWWLALELEIVAGIDAGIALSFWIDQPPLTGCIVGGEVDLAAAVPSPVGTIPLAVKLMLIWQREAGSAKFTFAGFSIQLGLGVVVPVPLAVGVFMAHQQAKNRHRRGSLTVLDPNGSSTIAVATPTTLTFTIEFKADQTTFEQSSTMTFKMPKSFSSGDIAAFKVQNPPDGWAFSVGDDNKLVLTATTQKTYNGGQKIQFTTDPVEASGQLNSGDVEKGLVIATLRSTDKVPIVLNAPLDVAWATFKATLNWNATIGSDPDYVMQFTTTACSPTACSGSNTAAYSQNSQEPICLAEAVDSKNNIWCFGYQYNYSDPGNPDNTGQLRAVIWREDLPVSRATTGKYVTAASSTKTTTATLGSSADGPTITISANFAT